MDIDLAHIAVTCYSDLCFIIYHSSEMVTQCHVFPVGDHNYPWVSELPGTNVIGACVVMHFLKITCCGLLFNSALSTPQTFNHSCPVEVRNG